MNRGSRQSLHPNTQPYYHDATTTRSCIHSMPHSQCKWCLGKLTNWTWAWHEQKLQTPLQPLLLQQTIAGQPQLASSLTFSQFPITDTGCGIINNDITPGALRDERIHLQKNTLINPKRHHRSQPQSPGYTRVSILVFYLCADIPHTFRAAGKERKK